MSHKIMPTIVQKIRTATRDGVLTREEAKDILDRRNFGFYVDRWERAEIEGLFWSVDSRPAFVGQPPKPVPVRADLEVIHQVENWLFKNEWMHRRSLWRDLTDEISDRLTGRSVPNPSSLADS